jgi:hypothetical protein
MRSDPKMDSTARLFFNQGTDADFATAYELDPEKFLALLFYIRDKNHGLGLRTLFCKGFTYLLTRNPSYMEALSHVPYYGSWKDLVLIAGTTPSTIPTIASLFAGRLVMDLSLMKGRKKVSTAAKWFPSPRTKMGKSPLAHEVRLLLGELTEASMRRMYLSPLRHYLGLVEIKMSKRDWSDIIPSQIPRSANQRYNQVLPRHGIVCRTVDKIPRCLTGIVARVLKGNPLKSDEYWKARLGTISAVNVAVVCDTTTPCVEVPIALGLAIGRNNLFAFTNPSSRIVLPPNASLASQISSIRETCSESSVSLSGIGSDLIIVVTGLPMQLEAIPTDKHVVWWNVSGLVPTIQNHRNNLVEITGFCEKIFETLLKGYIPNLNEIVVHTLSKYSRS